VSEKQINLLEKAKQILIDNWQGGFTVPRKKLYPFQWNWDSGFVSMGFGHFNLGYAMQELASLFSGQWKNGMIPHIIFHSENETTYFPNHDTNTASNFDFTWEIDLPKVVLLIAFFIAIVLFSNGKTIT